MVGVQSSGRPEGRSPGLPEFTQKKALTRQRCNRSDPARRECAKDVLFSEDVDCRKSLTFSEQINRKM